MRGLLLLLAEAFFLWMFLSTTPLERMADAGRIEGGPPDEVRELTYRYVAEWRHGLAGGWLLYVPGFFATAVATWFWSFGRSLRDLIPEYAAVTCLALVLAVLQTPAGTKLSCAGLVRDSALVCAPPFPALGFQGVMTGLYTLIAWSIVVLASHRALWWRSYWPLIVPVVTDVVLIMVRPFTFDDLVNTWIRQALSGQAIASLSLLLVPAVSAWLVLAQLAWERGRPK
jgi:hypothetical protein